MTPFSAALMKRIRAAPAVLVAVAILAGCGGNNTGEEQTKLSGEALETAATERGLFGAEVADPAGIFERRQGQGRDRVCAVTSDDGAWRFAAELQVADGGTCLTGGTLAVSAAENDARRTVTLTFQGLDHCAVSVTEQGDQLIFPAHMPANCSALCAGRVNLAGAEFDRTSWSQEEARILRLRRADGRMERACAA